jgi:hypothetical protein
MGSSLDELKRLVARNDETLLEGLERSAREMLGGPLAGPDFRPYIDNLLKLKLRGRPWARVLIADRAWATERSEAAPQLAESAWRSFRRRGDRVGRGFASFVLGNIELGRGNLSLAANWWDSARRLLGEAVPVSELNLAHLALGCYQVGDITGGLAIAEEAMALARLRGNTRAEALALIYHAFLNMNAGEMTRAGSSLGLANEIFAESDDAQDHYEYPVVYIGLASLDALRGLDAAAESGFARAIELAELVGNTWYAAFARTCRAEFFAHANPSRAAADARAAVRVFDELGDEWWRTWALRGHACAARELGQLKASRDLLQRLLQRPLNELERGRTLLALAETLLAMGGPGAEEAASEAVSIFEDAGARYLHARALAKLAECCPDQAADLVERIRQLSDGDLAYRQLYAPEGRLQIFVLSTPRVVVAGAQARFKTTKAELLVHALALAAPRGLHWEELAERIWRDVPAERAPQRLRTAMWEARRGLGPEAWRLSRKGTFVCLDMEGASLDYAQARDRAIVALAARPLPETDARAAYEALSPPILSPWAFEDWVQDLERERQALVTRLRRRRATRYTRPAI